MSKKFDSSSIFGALPSFWREYYKDKPVITSIYDAVLRLQESDYSRLFHIDDAKSIASVPVSTAYPVVYEELDKWEKTFPGHSHFYMQQAFSPVPQRYLGETNPLYYKVVVVGHLFLTHPQLYLNGRFVPSFLYVKSTDPIISDDRTLRGTTFYIEEYKLKEYIQSQQSLLQHWPEVEELDTVSIYSFDDVVPFYQDLSGLATEVAFPSLGGAEAVPELSSVVIESAEISGRVKTTYNTTYSSIVPIGNKRFVPGQVIRVLLENDTVQDIVAIAEDQIIVPTTLTVVEVHEVFNFTLAPSVLRISATDISLDKGRFPVGGVFRVTDNKGSFTVTARSQVNRLTLPRTIDTATAFVSIFNIDPTKVQILENRLVLGSRPVAGVRLRVEAALSREHAHEKYVVTLTANATSITLPYTPPAGHWVRLYADGLLLDTATYTRVNNVISFSELPAGTQLTALLTHAPDNITAHAHIQQEFVIPEGVQTTRSLLLDEKITGDSEVTVDVFIDSGMFNNAAFTAVADQNLVFDEFFVPGSFVSVFAEKIGRPFKHVLPERADSAYDYRGKIVDIAAIQDGLVVVNTTLTKGQNFDLVDENGLTYLYSDVALDKAWLFNVSVDERSLSKVWGTLFGIDDDSSDSSYRRVAALVAASRSNSLVDNIVNLGSIMLGSAYLEESGTSLGVVKEDDKEAVSISPADTESSEFTVPLIPGAAIRVRDGEQLPRLHAVNALVEVGDRELSVNKWLPVFAESLSTDFRIADRFDAGKPHKVISRPTSFDSATGILSDYSVDFIDAEVRPDDLIKIEFVPLDVVGTVDAEPTQLIRVTKVLGPHQLLLEDLTIAEKITGWGDLTFGAGAYGGGVFRPLIWRYTVWSRATRRLDAFTGLDTLPAEGRALVSAEDLTWLAARLSSVLKHHLFTLKLDWNSVKSASALDDLRRLLALIKPSETAAAVYTEFNNAAGLAETFSGQLISSSPLLSVAGNPVVDTLVVGESHLSGVFSGAVDNISQLYDPGSFISGPEAYAHAYGPDTQPAANRLYLTTERATMLLKGSAWASTYSTNHGLANLVLKSTYTSPFYTYSLYNSFGNRPNGRSVSLTNNRALTGTLALSPAFSFRTWLKIPTTHSMSPGMSPIIFRTQSGPQALLQVLSPNGFRFGVRISPAAVPQFAPTTFTRGASTFLAASVVATGTSTLYVNSVASSVSLGNSASFSGTLYIGSNTNLTTASRSIEAVLDETVFVGYTASPAVVSGWYNSGAGIWSGPLGVGQGPLAEYRAEMVLHYDLENAFGSIMFDHSGKGRDLVKTSTLDGDAATDWTVAGLVNTPLSSAGDLYNISRDGYHISDGVQVSANSEFALTDADGEQVPPSFFTVNRGDRVYYDPNVAYAYATSGGWVRKAYFANSIGSSIGASSQSEFIGFIAGASTAPDGTTTLSPMTSDIVIGDDPTITLSAKNNGAISAVTFSAYNYLYADRKGHLFQNKWDAGGAYTLCETGFDSLSPEASPKSRLISFSSNSYEAATSVYTAFASPRLVNSALLEASGDRLSKRVKTYALNNPHIVELNNTFDFYISQVNQSAAWVHSFAVQSPFTVAHSFNVGDGGRLVGTPITLSAPEDGRMHHLTTTFRGGVILSNSDYSRAIGLYHNGPSKPTHIITTDVIYETSPNPHIVFISREANQARSGYAQGVHMRDRYLCAGTFADVSAAFVELYNHLNNQNSVPPSTAVRIDAQPFTITGQALNSPFTVTVTALNNINAVDTAWSTLVTATLTSGTGLQGTLTRSPVSGVAVFSGLSFNTYGNKTIEFSSGTLTDTVDVVVPYPAPVITGRSPTTAAINYGTQSVAIFGQDFLPESTVNVSSVPVPSANVTYVSPGRINLALQLVPPPGLRRITVTNPTPGGGTSNFVGFLVTNPAPIILSPHYLQLGTVPLFWNKGQAEFITVTAFQSPSNAIATAADGLFKVNVYTGINQYVSTFSASPVAGIATVQPVIATAGTYRIDATHSPVTLGPARPAPLSQFLTVYDPDPFVAQVSPSWFAPSATAAPLINVFGSNFTSAGSILFNNSAKPTNFVSPGHVQAFLNVGDIAVQGTYPVQVRVPTAANQVSNSVFINVSPIFVPPVVVSPKALTLSFPSGQFNAGATVPFTSTVTGAGGALATYAAGNLRLTLSPLNDPLYPPFVGALTATAPLKFTNSVLTGSFSVNSFGQYRLTASYSPAIGEPVVTPASGTFSTLVSAPVVQRASPFTYSPLGTQVVSLIGSGFTNTAAVLYYTIPNASDVVTRTTTFVNSNKVTFTLSPSDYPAAGNRVAYTVVSQPFSTGNSGVQAITLATPPSTSPWYLSFQSDPTNPASSSQIPTAIRVGGGWVSGPQQVVVNAFTREDMIATTATGAAVLITSPQSAMFTGTLTLWQSFSSGQAVFPAASLAVSSYGQYVFKATHSPAGGVGYVMSPTGLSSVVNVLNYVPSITSVTPSSVSAGVGAVVVSIKGNRFLQDSPRGMTISIAGTNRNFTYLSPREVLLSLQPADTNNAGTLYANLTNYFSSATPPYQAAVATINVIGAAYNPNEETLSPTIEVSPNGWRRRLPTLGPWNTPNAPFGIYSASLRDAMRNSYPSASIPNPIIPVTNGLGAAEVVEVSAGAYAGWAYEIGSALNRIGMHRGVSRQQPYIVRAKKRPVGSVIEFEPVLIANPQVQTAVMADSGTTLTATVTSAGIDRPSFMTFLGLKVMCDGRDGLNWGVGDNANGTADYFYRDIKWVKCAFLGRWDYRTISLTPRRHTRSMLATTLAAQQQFNHLGNLITTPALGAGDSPLYSMNIQISEALACFSSELPGYTVNQSPAVANSLLVSAAVDQPVSLKGVIQGIPPSSRTPLSDPTGTIFRYLNPDIYTTGNGVNDYRVTVRPVIASGALASCVWGGGVNSGSNDVFANVEQAQGATPEILSTSPFWTSTRVLPFGELTRGLSYRANTTVPSRPLSGDIYAGVWSYQNVRFRKAGRYAFEAIVTRNGSQVPGSLPQYFFVNVTTGGVSQPDTRWEVMARNPVIPYLTTVSRSVPFSIPILVSLLEDTTPPAGHGLAGSINYRTPAIGISSQTNHGVTGITDSFMVTISSPDYLRKWRWAYADGTVYSPNLAGIGKGGFATNMVDGFITPLTPTTAAATVYGAPMLKCLSPLPAGVRQSVTINVRIRPGMSPTVRPGAYNFKASAPLSIVVDLSPTASAVGIPQAALTLPLTTETRGRSSLKAFTIEGGMRVFNSSGSLRPTSYAGRYFAPGWPGDPNHLNFELDLRRWWPSPVKNITYPDHGHSTKWGKQVYTHEGYYFLSSLVAYMQKEHNIYTHNCFGIHVENSTFRYAGRLNLQFTWRRWDNYPQPYDNSVPGRAGWITGNNRLNYSSIGTDLVIKGNKFADSGLNDGNVHVGITEHGGTTYMDNNYHLNGFNSELRHVFGNGGSSGTAFLVMYSGSAFKPTGNKQDMSWYFPYMTDAAGPVLNPVDLNQYTRGLPIISPGLYQHFSPGHPAYYIFTITRQMLLGGANDQNCIAYRDGTVWPESTTDINNPLHPYRNRAYGHPTWSTAGKTDYIEITPPWAQGDPLYPSGVVRLGAPQTNYPGAHQLGDFYMRNNIMYTNVYGANTVELVNASDSPSKQVRAPWVTPGQTPIGLRQAASFLTGANPGAGTRTGVFIGGPRTVYMEGNDIRHAPRPVVRISNVTTANSESSDPPALNVSGFDNNFVGGRDYFGHAPSQTGSASQQMSFNLFRALTSPLPGPPGQLF